MPLYVPDAATTITTQDEGSTLSSTVTTINFTGAGVTASGAGNTTTVNIPGGSGGNNGSATVDFGFATALEGDIATVTVSAAWVTTASTILVTPTAVTTAEHSGEDVIIEGITAYIANIVDNTSFDIIARAPNGSFGRYVINYTGV